MQDECYTRKTPTDQDVRRSETVHLKSHLKIHILVINQNRIPTPKNQSQMSLQKSFYKTPMTCLSFLHLTLIHVLCSLRQYLTIQCNIVQMPWVRTLVLHKVTSQLSKYHSRWGPCQHRQNLRCNHLHKQFRGHPYNHRQMRTAKLVRQFGVVF